jgi:hypothetical protein
MFKGSLLLLLDSCTTPLPAKLHALTRPQAFWPIRKDCELWPDKSQVRDRYHCVRDIRRSHCQPSCACVFAQRGSAHAFTLLIKRNCLVKIFYQCVSVFGTGGSLIPTLGWQCVPPCPAYLLPTSFLLKLASNHDPSNLHLLSGWDYRYEPLYPSFLHIFCFLKFIFILFIYFLLKLGLNKGLHACKAGALMLGPHLQSILFWLFWRWGLLNYFPRLALNHDPPYVSLPSR